MPKYRNGRAALGATAKKQYKTERNVKAATIKHDRKKGRSKPPTPPAGLSKHKGKIALGVGALALGAAAINKLRKKKEPAQAKPPTPKKQKPDLMHSVHYYAARKSGKNHYLATARADALTGR